MTLLTLSFVAHVLAAAFWTGAVLFFACTVLPASEAFDREATNTLLDRLFRVTRWTGIVLPVTGGHLREGFLIDGGVAGRWVTAGDTLQLGRRTGKRPIWMRSARFSMAERTDQRTRDGGVDDEFGVDVDGLEDGGYGGDGFESDTGTDQSSGGLRDRLPGGGSSSRERRGIRGRLADRVGGFFSLRSFSVALVLTVVFAFVAGFVIPFIPGSSLLGVFAAGFLLGMLRSEREYLEVGAATLFSGAITAVLSHLFEMVFLDVGIPLVAIGAGASGVAGLLGHYFGRDLRKGLSQDI